MRRKPHVLIVDDRPDDEARGYEQELRRRGLIASVHFPSDLDVADIKAADLILVDFDLSAWTRETPPGLEVARRPMDGVALASVLRRFLREVDDRPSPTSIALISQKIEDVMRPLPVTNRAHIAASLNGLEWIFDKQDAALISKIKSLAEGTLAMPKSWDGREVRQLRRLLAIDKANGSPRLKEGMLEDAMKCVPPIHEIRDWEQGVAFIRWLVQRILPYPCFLIDENHLAARFSIHPRVLRKLMAENSRLSKALAGYRYQGILAEFCGARWWRTGIEAFLWELTKQRSFDPGEVVSALGKLAKVDTVGADVTNGVAVLDEDFRYGDLLVEKRRALRIWPDDWPSYALQPWTSAALAATSPRLAAWVVDPDNQTA